jgi:GTP cyclohydrolase IA
MQTIETKNKVAEKFKDFMLSLNLDLENESLKDTPKRVAKMYINELFRGLYEEPPKITTFPNDEKYPGIVLVKNIKIQSFCEHHFLPII